MENIILHETPKFPNKPDIAKVKLKRDTAINLVENIGDVWKFSLTTIEHQSNAISAFYSSKQEYNHLIYLVKQYNKKHENIWISISIDGSANIVDKGDWWLLLSFNWVSKEFDYKWAIKELNIPTPVIELKEKVFDRSVLKNFSWLKDRIELLKVLFPNWLNLIWNWTNGVVFGKNNNCVIKLPRINIEGDKSFQYENVMQQVFAEGVDDLKLTQTFALTKKVDYGTALQLVLEWETLTEDDLVLISDTKFKNSLYRDKYKVPNIISIHNNHIEMEKIYWKTLVRLHTEKVLIDTFNITRSEIKEKSTLTDRELVQHYKWIEQNGLKFTGFPELNIYSVITDLYWKKQAEEFRAFKDILSTLGLTHLDMDRNPWNVMVDKNWFWYIIDFGNVADIPNDSPYRDIYENCCDDAWIHPDWVFSENNT